MVKFFAQAALSLHFERLRVRMARLEGKELELLRFIIEVRKETQAIREEFSPVRVDDSAASIRALGGQERVASKPSCR